MSTIMYLRKSRAEEHANTEETLHRHKEILTDLARQRGLMVDAIYEEVVSGESLYARPQMLALLERIGAGECEAVLCMDLDRLGRGGMRDQGIILDTFKWSGTKIITPDKTYDLSDDTDEELTEFKAFFARREYKMITKRMHRGLRRTIDEGGYVANAPYGYVKAMESKIPTLAVHEPEAYFVRMIFDLYVNKGLGGTTIADTINAMGAKPHRAEKFGRTSVLAIIKNPVYIGKVVWDKRKHIRPGRRGNEKHFSIYQAPEQWTVRDGHHPPIIDAELWQKAQAIVRERRHPPSNDGTVKNALAGLIFCGNCGSHMQRGGLNKGIPYLLCLTRGCAAGSKLEYVEQAVLDQLRIKMREIELAIPDQAQLDTRGAELALAETRKELVTLEGQKNRLHDLLEQGVYDVATFQQRMEALSGILRTAKERESSLLVEIDRIRQLDQTALVERIRTVLEAYDTATPRERNEMLKSVIQQVGYQKEKGSGPLDFEVSVDIKYL